MKQLSTLSLLFLLIYAGCASSESAVDTSSDETTVEELKQVRPQGSVSDEYQQFRDLSDFLVRIPGVNMSGNTVIIRGVSSFTAGIEPLFVVDGQVVGDSYLQVRNMINIRDIDYVRALKGADASRYGVRGGNGVILIVTKK